MLKQYNKIKCFKKVRFQKKQLTFFFALGSRLYMQKSRVIGRTRLSEVSQFKGHVKIKGLSLKVLQESANSKK